ncbi:putative membrane protein [Streptosporangium becharense]|uniref:Putative membrane protein n=1 Tax=Streptosporangium becharense TaxID=1816182 RepID=A0A7W9MG92_9ACTN|nr:YhgE/Pip domain-containing protein [Streptosporangium becharense]MBB2909836.1 putative membrane protein [Streptosporangium becharense]MBB5819209.1 putative membrane protein [Streptosporangium becharense]
MRPLRAATLELRRFTRSRLTRAALAGVVMLPLLYAGLYLWSFWDPQGHLDRVPVALVVEDRPATVDGTTVDAGRELAEELRERGTFDWHPVNARQAADGVHDGSFYLSLTVPADFSARLASPAGDGTPVPAELGVQVDTGRSYIMGSISDAVFAEVKAAASRTALKDYWDSVFVSFGKLHDATVQAADGADELHDGTAKAGRGAATLGEGLGEAGNGAHRLAVGLGSADTAVGRLSAGARELTSGLRRAENGSRELGRGLAALRKGAERIADGNAQAYRQVHSQVAAVNRVADDVTGVLERDGARIQEFARAVEQGVDLVADGAGTLPAGLREGAEQSAEQSRRLRAWLDANPEADPELRAIADRLASATGQVAGNLTGAADGGAADRLRHDARRISELAGRTAEVVPGLGHRFDQARRKLDELDKGLGTLAEGSAELHAGLTKAGTAGGTLTSGLARLGDGSARLGDGLAQLGGGIVRLNDGAARVDTGIGRLRTGADELSAGIGRLADGSRELSDKLGDGAGEIPDYDGDERASRAGVMSDPVRLDERILNEVPDYGTGFAPFFVPLALWVGAMVAYMVLRPLNPRLLAGTAPAWRIVAGGWLPALALAAAQVGVLLAVIRFGLGMEAAHWAGVAGFLLLAAAAFTALVQAVNALLGPPGRIVVLALLMLQLTSAAGTYPIETSPGFFRTISPWLPMSWVVSALRRLISGGDLTVVWQACGVLTAFTALGLALSVHAVHRGRTWSMRRLHPELAL